MTPETSKGKALSSAEIDILDALEHGAHFNTTHTSAADLLRRGLVMAGWGRLSITEAGRIALRRSSHAFLISDPLVADLAIVTRSGVDPMTAPHLVNHAREILDEVIVTELPPTSDRVARALRAAGVASGVTGVWVDEKWVRAFVDALDAQSADDAGDAQHNETKTETSE